MRKNVARASSGSTILARIRPVTACRNSPVVASAPSATHQSGMAWTPLSSRFAGVPLVIAGPILRPHELIPQLEVPRAATLRGFAAPLAIFTLGLVKKLVFADQLAPMVTATYAQDATTSALAAGSPIADANAVSARRASVCPGATNSSLR